LFIGLMSGTSMDGVDGVVADFGDAKTGANDLQVAVVAHHHAAMPAALQSEMMALNTPGLDELHRAACAAHGLARLQVEVVAQLLRKAALDRGQITAVGSHGQTVRHRPEGNDGIGYSCQLNQGALLAELCGIDVVCDFRSRDIAAGGQGAPLVPPFHAAVFGSPTEARAVLNIGGIANLTLIAPTGADSTAGSAAAAAAAAGSSAATSRVRGFDCGPGNALLDLWTQRHLGMPFDQDGQWGKSGVVDAALLARLLSEPYLAQAPPKSTGRDLFNARWLDKHLSAISSSTHPADVQATLTELTAQAAAQALARHATGTKSMWVCGGGVKNSGLMRRLADLLPAVHVDSTQALGLPPDQVEAAAFAWLARAFVRREPANAPEVTGAKGARILGALYPAQ
jgi:anhydro-N-acetylmuramic acid kinase